MSIEIIHNAITGEITERPFTKSELVEVEKKRVEQQKLIATQQAEQIAREAVLSKLGLTADEIAALSK